MPAQANISILDGAATPVAHVFAPKGARMQGGRNVALWRDETQPMMASKWTIDEVHTPSQGKSPEKFRWVLKLPTSVTDNSTGQVSVPRFQQAEIQVFLTPDATPEEVNHMQAIAKSFVSSPYFQDAVRKREATW